MFETFFDQLELYGKDNLKVTDDKENEENLQLISLYTNLLIQYLVGLNHNLERIITEKQLRRLAKAIIMNKLVIDSTFPFVGVYFYLYLSYDIDTGRLTHMTVYDDLLISNKDDKYVSKIIGTYEYYNKEILYILNPDDNTSIDIRNWTDPFVCINAYALSKDGKYLALLTADSLIKDEYVITYDNTGIIIIDLEQKKVLVQD